MNSEKYVNQNSDSILKIENRKYAYLSGVFELLSFDEFLICASTVCGKINFQGKELRIKNLDLEKGVVEIEGMLDEAYYVDEDSKKEKHSFVGKIFR